MPHRAPAWTASAPSCLAARASCALPGCVRSHGSITKPPWLASSRGGTASCWPNAPLFHVLVRNRTSFGSLRCVRSRVPCRGTMAADSEAPAVGLQAARAAIIYDVRRKERIEHVLSLNRAYALRALALSAAARRAVVSNAFRSTCTSGTPFQGLRKGRNTRRFLRKDNVRKDKGESIKSKSPSVVLSCRFQPGNEDGARGILRRKAHRVHLAPCKLPAVAQLPPKLTFVPCARNVRGKEQAVLRYVP